MNGERAADDSALLPTTRSAPRMQWMDTLRGAAVLLVIAFHASSILELYDASTPTALRYFNEVLAPFRMPTLVFLSGLLLQRSLQKPPREYIVGKSGRILYPSVVWTLVTAAVVGLADWTRPLAWVDTHLWYLNFLFLYYLLALALRRLLIEHPDTVVAAIAAVGLVVAAVAARDSVGQRFVFLCVFFFLGYWAARRGALLDTLLRSRWTWCAVPVALGFATMSTLTDLDRYDGLAAPGIAVAVIVLARCAVAVDGTAWARPLVAIGEMSVVYYVTHFVVIAVVIRELLLPELVGAWTAVLVGFVAALAVGYAASVAVASDRLAVRYLFEAPSGR